MSAMALMGSSAAILFSLGALHLVYPCCGSKLIRTDLVSLIGVGFSLWCFVASMAAALVRP